MNAAFSSILFLLSVSLQEETYISIFLLHISLLSLLPFFFISERLHSAPIFVILLSYLLKNNKNQK